MPDCNITTRPSIGCSADAGVTPGNVATRLISSQTSRAVTPSRHSVLRLQHHVGFDHRGRRGIECRFHATDLAEHVLDFGNLADQDILRLQHLHRLREARRRVQRRHVEPTALVQGDPIVTLQAREGVLRIDVAGKIIQFRTEQLWRTSRPGAAPSAVRSRPQTDHQQDCGETRSANAL